MRFLVRRAERTAVDRDGHLRVGVSRAAVRALLRAGRRRRARRDDDPARHADDGRDDAPRAASRCARRRSRSATRAGARRCSIVLRTALPGIVTGALVAVARIAGETAPLLFTAFGNQFWSTSLTQPIAALPLQIFTYAHQPLRRLARAGLGGRTRPHRPRPRHQSRRALRDAVAIRARRRLSARCRFRSARRRTSTVTPDPLQPSGGCRRIATEALDAYFGATRVVRDVSFDCPIADRSRRSSARRAAASRRCSAASTGCTRRFRRARVEGEVRLEGQDIYGAGVERDRRAPAHRNGLPAADAVPDDVDPRQRRRGLQRFRAAERPVAKRDGRASSSARSSARRCGTR